MNVVFEALYFLQKDSYYKKVYYASRAFSSLVTAQIVINNQFPWNPKLMSWLQNILMWLSIPVQNASVTQYYWLLAFTVAVIFLCTGLYYYVCYQIHVGTMNNHRVTKILRFLLGILVTLSNPVLSIMLASVNCDWAGGSNLSLNWDTTENCPSRSSRVVLMIVSSVTFVPFIVLVILSTIMHVSDPKTSMILSRAHSRVDLLSVMADTISNALFVFLIGYKGLLASIYVVLQLSVTASFVLFQPYYHTFSNDLFTMFSAQTLWAGISFAVLAGTSDGGRLASIILFVGVLPVGLLAFWLSSHWRARVIREALEEYDGEEEVEVKLADDEVFPVLREKYDRNSTTFFVTDIKAALVELRTRFLLTDDSARAIAIAENIYKDGMMQYPQSVYLRLQYVSFLLYYRNDPTLASLRLTEIMGLEIDIDMRFSVLRKKREVERKRHVGQMGNSALGMDSISFEEVKTRIKDVRGLHKKAIELSEQLWKTLARKVGGGRKNRGKVRRLMRRALSRRVHPVQQGEDEIELNAVAPGRENGQQQIGTSAASPEEILAAIEPIVAELQRVTDQADVEYAILWAQCGDSKEVASEYSRYLRNIKKDSAAADEIEDRLQVAANRGDNHSVGDNSSRDGASSQGSLNLTADQQHQRQKLAAMTNSFSERVTALKMRLRIVTFLLVAASVASFSVFYVISSNGIPIFESMLESGTVRFSCVISAHELRQMHLFALRGDEAGFNKTRSFLNSSMISGRELRYGLAVTYRTDFDLRNNYMNVQNVNSRRVGTANSIVSEKLSPDELVMRVIDSAFDALNQPFSRYASMLGRGILQFPQYFFVLENALECTRAMDTLSEMYRLELEQRLGYASKTLIAMCVVVVLTEFWTVFMLFRPAVNRAFDEVVTGVSRFIQVPLETSKELASQESKHLARFRVLSGDEHADQSSVMDVDELRTTPRASPRRVRVQMDASPRSRLGFLSPREDFSERPVIATGTRRGSILSLNSVSHGAVGEKFESEQGSTQERKTSAFEIDLTEAESLPNTTVQGSFRGLEFEHLDSDDDNGSNSGVPFVVQMLPVESSQSRIPEEAFRLPAALSVPVMLPALYAPVPASPTPSSPSSAGSGQRLLPSPSHSRRSSVSLEMIDGPSGEVENRDKQPKGFIHRLQQMWQHRRRLSESAGVSRRKLPIIATYVFMLLVIINCISVVTALGMQANNEIFTAAPSIINAARRRYMFELAYFFGNEAYLSITPFSLVGSGLSSWNVPDLHCRMIGSATLGLMMHYGVLYGTDEGFRLLPEARGFVSVDSIVNSECSSVTRNTDMFYSSIQMKGLALDPLYSNFYFVPQCPSLNDFPATSTPMTDPRIYRYTKTLSIKGCPLFTSGQVTDGFHRLIDTSFTACFEISTTNLSSPLELNSLKSTMARLTLLQDPTTDLMAGLVKVVLISMGHSIDVITKNQMIMSAVFAIIMFMIISQYLALGKRIQMLMKDNLSMTLLCERMLENAVCVMKKQGYSSEATRKLTHATATDLAPINPRMDSEIES